MYSSIEDNDLLEKYNTIWDKVSADIEKEFDSKPVYNKFLKMKIIFYSDEATYFHKGSLEVDSNLTCLAVISLDSPLNKDGNYYPPVFLKECKYIEKVIIRHIMEDTRFFPMIPMNLTKNSLFL